MSIGESLNPVVLLHRLTEEEIKFYTTARPKRRSSRKRKEKINLKDEQHVDFSFFEEYRRSRNSYLKKEEKKKKGIKFKKKNETLTEIFQLENLGNSAVLDSGVLGSNDTNKVKIVKEKKEKKPPTEKKLRTKKPRMKFKRMVIESDSDCSVENYGIVYSNEVNLVQTPQQHNLGTAVNMFSSSAMTPNSLPFQTCMSSPNISPPCSEVIVNEHDILSALDCEPEQHYNASIKDRLSTRKERNLLDILSGSQDDSSDFMSWMNSETSGVTPLQITSSISAYDSNIKAKDSSYDVVKESSDLVSEIMKDMDREFANRKKNVFPKSKTPPVQIELPNVSVSTVQQKSVPQKPSSRDKFDKCDKLPIVKRTASDLLHNSEMKKKKQSSALQSLLVTAANNPTAKFNNSERTPKPVKTCSKCHVILKPGSCIGNFCVSCRSSMNKTKHVQKSNADLKKTKLIPLPVRNPIKKTNQFRSIGNKSLLTKFRRSITKKLSFHDRARFHAKHSPLKKCRKIPDYFSDPEEPCDKSIVNEKGCKTTQSVVSLSQSQGDKAVEFSDINRKNVNTVKSGVTEKNIDTPSTSSPETSEKSGFVVKAIKKGLLLMTVPDPDKELDFSADTSKINEDSTKLLAPVESSSSNNAVLPPITSSATPVSPSTAFKKIDCKYSLPNMPIQIVAHYAKDQQGSDFHLSSVSYLNRSQEQSVSTMSASNTASGDVGNNISVLKMMNTESTVTNNKTGINQLNTAAQKPCSSTSGNPVDTFLRSNISVTVLSKSTDVAKSQLSNNLSQVSGVTITALPEPVEDNDSSATGTDLPSTYADDVNVRNSKSTNKTTSNVHPAAKLTKTKKKASAKSNQSETDSTSLVLHELDAIAILSILDLDGNEQHASNLLENLFVKELEELQKIKHVYHETTENEIKIIADMKCKAKLSRIKSLSIARALLKKYGQLSKVVEAILNKPSSDNSVPYDSVSAAVEDPQLPISFSTITKVEKNRILSDCRMAQQISVELPPKPVPVPEAAAPPALPPPPPYHPPITYNMERAPTVCIKPEKGTTSSSCSLSNLNVNKTPPALPQISVNQIQTNDPGLSSHLGNASLAALVQYKSGSQYGGQPAAPQINPSTSHSYPVINHTSNIPAILPAVSTITTSVIKGEAGTARSSCQLQNQSSTSQLQIQPSLNQQSQQQQSPVSSQFSLRLQSLLSPPTNNVPVSMQMQQQSPNLQYKALVPVQTMMAAPNRLSCPNVTVPFSMPNPMPTMGNNRSLVSMNFVQTNNAPPNNLLQNPLQIRHVVLSNMPSLNNQQQQQTGFTVTPYNYVPPQPVASNALVPTQPMSNMYAAYQSPNTNSASIMAQANAVPIHSIPNGNSSMSNLLLNCFVCKSPASMRCKQCAQVVYCSTDCARVYWHQRHKMECQPTQNMS